MGCPQSQPCPQHERVDRHQASAADRGYDRRWRTRAAAFLRKYPRCGDRPGGLAPVMSRCHAEGRITRATLVDHVVPHKGRTALFNDLIGNAQGLCRRCHGEKTAAGL